MSWFVVDVESDGPCPGLFSMVSFGAVRVDRELETTFYGRTAPISPRYEEEALAVSNTTRAEHEKYPEPQGTMKAFADWLAKVNEGPGPIFVSDNPAFDWQFINYYFHLTLGKNPFGFSARRIGDLFAGMQNDVRVPWKHLRKTRHTHHPVDDAKGNAEAILAMVDMGLLIPGLKAKE